MPSSGALASAGFVIYAGNHRGMPCTTGLSRLDQIMLSTACAAYQCTATHLLNEAAVVIDDGSLEQVHPEQP